MHEEPKMPRPKRLPLMVALALASLSAPSAHALTMTATGVYSLGGGSPVTVTDGPSSTYVDIIPFVADSAGNSVFFHVYGSASGSSAWFGSRSSGEGIFDALGTFHLEGTFANPNPGSNVIFQFYVEGGELDANTYGSGAGTGSASYQIKVNVDGGAVEHEATASVDSTGACSTTNTGVFASSPLVTCNPGDTSYYWNGQYFYADLGPLGDTFTLDYDMITHAVGNYGSTGSSCYGAYGDVVVDGGEGANPMLAVVDGGEGYGGGYPCPTSGAEARIGDPFNFGPSVNNPVNVLYTGFDPSNPTGLPASVPAPGTLLLALAGAAALAGTRRRREPEEDSD